MSLSSMNFSVKKCIFIVTGLMGLSMEAQRKQDLTEVLWRLNRYNAKFSLKNTFKEGSAIEYSYFQWL